MFQVTAEQCPLQTSLPPEQTPPGPEAELCCLDKKLTDNSDEDVALPSLQVFTGIFRCRIFHFAQVHQGTLFIHKINAICRERCGEGSPGCPRVANMSLWGLRGIFLGKLHFEQNLLRSGEWGVCCPFFPVFWGVL